MNKPVAAALLLVACVSGAQQTPAKQDSAPKEPPTQQMDFFQRGTNGSIFIYGTEVDPCTALPPEKTLVPRGSGFVTGLVRPHPSTPHPWAGWKLLVSAKHVVEGQAEIVVRVNADNQSKFVCKTLKLQTQGPERNVVLARPGVDLVAILLPQIEGADPTLVPSSYVLDEARMKSASIGVGTQVVTIGYLLGYSGRKANFPIAKFGHISVITDEDWYLSPNSHMMEQGLLLDLANAPGLSGAPVFVYGVEIETDPFRYRRLPSLLVGVVKGLLLAPAGQSMISQGVAVIEPASNLRNLMRQVSALLKARGAKVEEID